MLEPPAPGSQTTASAVRLLPEELGILSERSMW